jgi:hypothetical protein
VAGIRRVMKRLVVVIIVLFAGISGVIVLADIVAEG